MVAQSSTVTKLLGSPSSQKLKNIHTQNTRNAMGDFKSQSQAIKGPTIPDKLHLCYLTSQQFCEVGIYNLYFIDKEKDLRKANPFV